MQQSKRDKLHPAIEWAIHEEFSPSDVDCTTAVALKILDNKCKMLPGEKEAVLAIYDAVKNKPAKLFDTSVHNIITCARKFPDEKVMQAIHALRLTAESNIPKPVMKRYKAFLRNGLFGE